MKISLAQINPVLGDFEYNLKLIISYVKRACNEGSDLVIFPESCLFGYHPFDLLEYDYIVKKQIRMIEQVQKKIPQGVGVLFGAICENKNTNGRPYFNSAVFAQSGKKTKIFNKQLLPTYDVFDEARHIEEGDVSKNILKFKGKTFLVTVCEDIWAWTLPGHKTSKYKTNPMKGLKGQRFDMVLNISASPYCAEKLKQRLYVTKKMVELFKCPMIYTNMVGAQDELVFDGGSFAIDKKANIVARAEFFKEDLVSVSFDKKTNQITNGQKRVGIQNKTQRNHEAISLGIRDFVNKTGLNGVHLGLSGGIDSAVVACAAVKALGPKNVTCIAMPGAFNDPKSLSSAKKLASNIGAKFLEMPIEGLYKEEVNVIEDALGAQEFGLMHENLQARTRGLLLMSYANLKNSLLLNTSNKSELSMGYSTLYGDLCGGLSPIGDLLKTEVFELAEFINKDSEVIPRFIIDRPPSAELRPDQTDEESLPKYEWLDRSVFKIVTQGKAPKTPIDKRVVSALMKTEFKRWQAPPILKLSERAFGRGRRLPIAHRANFKKLK